MPLSAPAVPPAEAVKSELSGPVATYVDADGLTCHVFVEKVRRSWVVTVGFRVDELVDAPDARDGAIGIAREYAAAHDRSKTRRGAT